MHLTFQWGYASTGWRCLAYQLHSTAPLQFCGHKLNKGKVFLICPHMLYVRHTLLHTLHSSRQAMSDTGPSLSCIILQVIVYDAVTRQVRRQFTRFKDKAYCGNFRSDSKLLVAGGEDGIVQVRRSTSKQCPGLGSAAAFDNVQMYCNCSCNSSSLHCWLQIFDAGSRTMLRQLKAHKRAAHVAHFSPDRMHVLSAADDTTVCALRLYLMALSMQCLCFHCLRNTCVWHA